MANDAQKKVAGEDIIDVEQLDKNKPVEQLRPIDQIPTPSEAAAEAVTEVEHAAADSGTQLEADADAAVLGAPEHVDDKVKVQTLVGEGKAKIADSKKTFTTTLTGLVTAAQSEAYDRQLKHAESQAGQDAYAQAQARMEARAAAPEDDRMKQVRAKAEEARIAQQARKVPTTATVDPLVANLNAVVDDQEAPEAEDVMVDLTSAPKAPKPVDTTLQAQAEALYNVVDDQEQPEVDDTLVDLTDAPKAPKAQPKVATVVSPQPFEVVDDTETPVEEGPDTSPELGNLAAAVAEVAVEKKNAKKEKKVKAAPAPKVTKTVAKKAAPQDFAVVNDQEVLEEDGPDTSPELQKLADAAVEAAAAPKGKEKVKKTAEKKAPKTKKTKAVATDAQVAALNAIVNDEEQPEAEDVMVDLTNAPKAPKGKSKLDEQAEALRQVVDDTEVSADDFLVDLSSGPTRKQRQAEALRDLTDTDEAIVDEGPDTSEDLENLAAAVSAAKKGKERVKNVGKTSEELAASLENVTEDEVDIDKTTLEVADAVQQHAAEKAEKARLEALKKEPAAPVSDRYDTLRKIPFLAGVADRMETNSATKRINKLSVDLANVESKIELRMKEMVREGISREEAEKMPEIQKLMEKAEWLNSEKESYERRRDSAAERAKDRIDAKIGPESPLREKLRQLDDGIQTFKAKILEREALIKSLEAERDELKDFVSPSGLKDFEYRIRQERSKIDLLKLDISSLLVDANGIKVKIKDFEMTSKAFDSMRTENQKTERTTSFDYTKKKDTERPTSTSTEAPVDSVDAGTEGAVENSEGVNLERSIDEWDRIAEKVNGIEGKEILPVTKDKIKTKEDFAAIFDEVKKQIPDADQETMSAEALKLFIQIFAEKQGKPLDMTEQGQKEFLKAFSNVLDALDIEEGSALKINKEKAEEAAKKKTAPGTTAPSSRDDDDYVVGTS